MQPNTPSPNSPNHTDFSSPISPAPATSQTFPQPGGPQPGLEQTQAPQYPAQPSQAFASPNPSQTFPQAPSPYPSQSPAAPFSAASQLPPPTIASASAEPTRENHPSSTQSNLLISELRDSMVIMKDGSFRAVVACQSINFDLMSESEREGIEYSYQGFLNSLNFTTQILVRSQRVDIGPYIDNLTQIRRNNDNMLLGVLMDDYINFIDLLSQEANIMDKSFFIIIPYYTSIEAEKLTQQTKNFLKSFGNTHPIEATKIDRITYDKAITEINHRVEAVVSGLFQIGVHALRLNTRELSQLFYNFNNPDTAVRQPLVDFNKLATTYVQKGPNPYA